MQNNKSEQTNIEKFDVSRTMDHCTVVTFDGIPGFAWYDRLGNRHNEGLKWPQMKVIRDATVELFYNSETAEHSAAWSATGKTSEIETEWWGERNGDTL